MGQEILTTEVRADDGVGVYDVITRLKPDRVISLLGRTHGEGSSTIDYLEQKGKLVENVRDNLFAPVTIANVCMQLHVHFTYLGTGCIFTYDEHHTTQDGFKETSAPNFFGSSYSVVKGFTDRLMGQMPGVLNVRIRMPITADYHPRNFITKITSYDKICSYPNSMTVLPELIPLMLDMSLHAKTGTINLTNPGVISHNEILQMYRDIVDPDFCWKNFSEEEQRLVIASDRSNNYLDTSKLQQLYPQVKNITESIKDVLHKMKNNL